MNTENLNIPPQNGGSDNKSEKCSGGKKNVGKAAQFAGAVGLGVAGTMAANAMNNHDDETINLVELKEEFPEDTVVEEVVEEQTVFDPNDIQIGDINEVGIDDGIIELSTDASHPIHSNDTIYPSPEPITVGEYVEEPIGIIAPIEIPVEITDDPVGMMVDSGIEPEPTNYDDYDDETLFADNDTVGEEPDILGDILNA